MTTPKEQAKVNTERLKTEAIHAQAMQLEYMRQRLLAAEDEVKRLTNENRTLQLKLSSANRVLEQLKGAPNGS